MAKLFEEYQLKDVKLRNRIVVSPMCQYCSEDGFPNEWHMVHLGSRAVGGAGLVIVEATAVSPEGRISPMDSGIWSDDHVEPFSRIAKFMKRMGAVPGMQIAHAGRKASASVPWEGNVHLPTDQGGWDTIAPSALAFGAKLDKVPKAMIEQEIAKTKQDFVDAAKRALAAGFEWLELHYAHGYLMHEFYSPLTNHRQDNYGGSFDNRARFLLETLQAVREVWPENLPLTARLSVTDWISGGVSLNDSITLANRMKEAGLDLLDVSHGMITPDHSNVPSDPGFMVPYAHRIRKEVSIPVSVGWLITEPKHAAQIIALEQADLIVLARELLRDPYWPYHAAKELGEDVQASILPVQYARAVQS